MINLTSEASAHDIQICTNMLVNSCQNSEVVSFQLTWGSSESNSSVIITEFIQQAAHLIVDMKKTVSRSSKWNHVLHNNLHLTWNFLLANKNSHYKTWFHLKWKKKHNLDCTDCVDVTTTLTLFINAFSFLFRSSEKQLMAQGDDIDFNIVRWGGWVEMKDRCCGCVLRVHLNASSPSPSRSSVSSAQLVDLVG